MSILCAAAKKLQVWRLGLMPYDRALALQFHIREERIHQRCEDVLISVQHPPTITLGRNKLSTSLLTPKEELEWLGIALHCTERGGDATFHGPGQPVLYPIVSVRGLKVGPRRFVEGLENVMVDVAKSFNLNAEGQVQFQSGCWIDKDRKIGAVGIRLSGTVTMHGLAFNVNPDLSYYRHIIPCGLVGKEVTSLVKELGSSEKVDENAVTEQLIQNFVRIMGYEEVVDKDVDMKELNNALESNLQKIG